MEPRLRASVRKSNYVFCRAHMARAHLRPYAVSRANRGRKRNRALKHVQQKLSRAQWLLIREWSERNFPLCGRIFLAFASSLKAFLFVCRQLFLTNALLSFHSSTMLSDDEARTRIISEFHFPPNTLCLNLRQKH
jgi:hypothetical protein